MSDGPRVAIVGGGIAGLTAAWRLSATAEVVVFEAAPRFGGKIRTERVDGFTVEAGADSFLTSKPWALELARELGIDDELTGIRRLEHRARIRGPRGLEPLPAGLTGLVPDGAGSLLAAGLLSLPGRLRAAMDLVLPRGPVNRDESIASFVRRRFGGETYDRFMEPLLAGIHGGDGEALSLPAAFPALAEAERRSGSVIRGLRSMRQQGPGGAGVSSFVTLKTGMQRLIDALVERLAPVRLLTDARVTSLHRSGDRWYVEAEGWSGSAFEGVIVAAPANAASRLLGTAAPELASLLGRTPFASTMVVQIGFDAASVPVPLDSGGYLNPRSSGRPISACTFVSSKFEHRAPEGCVLIRLIPRLDSRASLDALTDDLALALAQEELEDTLGIRDAPLWSRVYRFPDAMPQYTLGHLERLRAIRDLVTGLPGLALAGHSYDGIGIPDAVRSADTAARAVRDWLAVTTGAASG